MAKHFTCGCCCNDLVFLRHLQDDSWPWQWFVNGLILHIGVKRPARICEAVHGAYA